MRMEIFRPTFSSSFWGTPVGSRFHATDLAGLTTAQNAPNMVGICVARTSSETWDLDTFRVHSEGPADKFVRVDRWIITWADGRFLRSL